MEQLPLILFRISEVFAVIQALNSKTIFRMTFRHLL